MDEKIIGVPRQKFGELLASLICAAVGMIFINLGLIGGIAIFPPVKYSFAGFGIVFLVVSIFFIYDVFRGGFFNPESAWEDAMRFNKVIGLLWLILFIPFLVILLVAIMSVFIG